MLRNGFAMYLWIPSESTERILHPGKVKELDQETFVAEFEEVINVEAGADVSIFAEVRDKFFQQSANVVLIRQTDPNPVIAFKKIGEPVNAESRSSFRVSTVTAGMLAKIDKEMRCHVVDISPEGFGAISDIDQKPGTIVSVFMVHEGQTLAGKARVQTARQRIDGKFRCGFFVLEPAMRRTLEKMYSIAQRAQLRRLAGTA